MHENYFTNDFKVSLRDTVMLTSTFMFLLATGIKGTRLKLSSLKINSLYI